MAELSKMKGLAARDRELIQDAERMLGPEPNDMGFVKNLFWGNVREDLVFPYPETSPEETARCDQMLAALDDYLLHEHPAIEIDQEEEIPRWVVDKLFDLGVMGMIIPKEYGGQGMGVTSYNRVLERIGRTCASTSVLVSAHQSIGCKAIVLFGTEKQKKMWLPHLAKDWLSAFCLSEPNVGCDAGGQETRCEVSEDGAHYILNGEKKWSTSGALAQIFTVMAKQKIVNPKTGKETEKVTAIVCTPEMPGVHIFEKNRSKYGIRGTWQARLRFENAKAPRENLLHIEGKGLSVALTCLNFGRCTLSAGVIGAAKGAADQAIKWTRTRHQFKRPLSDFELVKLRIARMSALNYAADAVLYMTTGVLDNNHPDLMLETALCKVFCSEMGWQVINDAMQVMGGESYMTENEIERAFRDSRIYLIVEGANEVMQSFVFGYGAKQLAEQMLAVQEAVGWDNEQAMGENLARIIRNGLRPSVMKLAIPLGLEVMLGWRKSVPVLTRLHGSLDDRAKRFCALVREHSHQFKVESRRHAEKILDRQAVQARIADNAMWLYAMACSLSRFDRQIRQGEDGVEFERDKTACMHFLDLAEVKIRRNFVAMTDNADESMRTAAQAAIAVSDSQPNNLFIIPECSPVAAGTGRTPPTAGVRQFPGNDTTLKTKTRSPGAATSGAP